MSQVRRVTLHLQAAESEKLRRSRLRVSSAGSAAMASATVGTGAISMGAAAAPPQPSPTGEVRVVPAAKGVVHNKSAGHPAHQTVPIKVIAGPNPKARRPLRRYFLLAGGIIALVVLGYFGWLTYSLIRAENTVYKPRPQTVGSTGGGATPTIAQSGSTPTAVGALIDSTATPDPASGLPKGRINILVLGTDKRPNDVDHYARSDTMILVNLDTVAHKARVMGIPRDLVVSIPGYGVNKVNSAYMFGEYYKEPGGGQALAADTVGAFFHVPIDYYIAVNFQGFRTLIDTLGGIDIDVPYAIDDFHYPSDDEGDPFGELHIHFDAGLQHMDGKEALRYARTRHADNDFARNKRQLDVMVAARRAALKLDLIPKIPTIIDQVAGMVETDIPFDKQLDLARFGYSLQSTDIITSTISRDLVTPVILDDGSEGLRLDWSSAEPMLSEFFGRTTTEAASTTAKGTPGVEDLPTEPDPANAEAIATATSSRRKATATPAPRRTPTRIPSARARP